MPPHCDTMDGPVVKAAMKALEAGEGAPFTGLKPAGLDVGPVIPVAEKAIETGSPDAVLDLMSDMVRDEVKRRFEHVMHLKAHAGHHAHE